MPDRTEGRVVAALKTVPRGQIMTSSEKVRRDIKKGSPDRHWGLGICKVTNIDYEEFQVSLASLVGAGDEFDRLPVPLTFPGAGNRHFFGAMPQIGDLCVVGWAPQESSQNEGTRTPVILTWLLPGVWPGREWITTAGFTDKEYDAGTEKNRRLLEGVHDRIRHKLRHIQPGNIVASSSQGSDLVLDEGVVLANRRGNELRLRDQDQALVTRSLQQFHAMGGARIYGGMVQRDALLLATTMVSDGKLWDGPLQSETGNPITDENLPADLANPLGYLTPARPLNKGRLADDGRPVGDALIQLESHLDPYTFLLRGGYINTDGFVADDLSAADAVYGGKAFFRVAAQSASNAVIDADRPTLTEYRIEVAHTSDGRLPVTEQTDMFDAERLPPTDPESGWGRTKLPPNAPFIEHVMGSVVGNDPYSQQGRLRYGLPLRAVIFDGDSPSPRLEPIKLVDREDSSESPTPLEEHAATLFRLTPPLSSGASPDTFWSVNKNGQLKAALGGPVNGNSVEAALRGGLKLSVGGEFQLIMDSQVKLSAKKGDKKRNVGVELESEQGAVRIYGGGRVRGAESVGGRNPRVGRDSSPSVDIEARADARLKAEQKVSIKGAETEVNATKVDVSGHQSVTIQSAESIEMSSKSITMSHAGKRTESFTGPKDSSPTNGALHEKTYAPTIPGLKAEESTYESGDRQETFRLGNHETSIQVGNLTYKTAAGSFTASAGANSLTIETAGGISGQATAGSISFSAVAGSSQVSGNTGVTISSSAGKAQLVGATGVSLLAPIFGPDQGPIICAGSLEPFTGLPFSTWGMGAKLHLVGPVEVPRVQFRQRQLKSTD